MSLWICNNNNYRRVHEFETERELKDLEVGEGGKKVTQIQYSTMKFSKLKTFKISRS